MNRISNRLQGEANVGKITNVDEAKEMAFFWSYFPEGKKPYANAEYLKWNTKSPRLFQCSNTTGSFKVIFYLLCLVLIYDTAGGNI